MNRILQRLCFLGIALDVGLMLAALLHGMPFEVFGLTLAKKNLRRPFFYLMILIAAALITSRDRPAAFARFQTTLEGFSQRKSAPWILALFAGIFFTWQQLNEYYGVEINFIPFGFYDYMLFYLFEGKIHFTGILHGYYHANSILYLLAPLWALWKSPMVLVLAYGFIASAAAVPLWRICERILKEPLAAFFVTFTFLNFRYLQNLLQMNFCVEIFYPLILFAAASAALGEKWLLYYLFLFAGLNIKEDAFVYFSALGLFVFFLKRGRLHGVLTPVLSCGYFLFLTRVLLPAAGSDIMEASMRNFSGYGDGAVTVVAHFLTHPWEIPAVFLDAPEKIETLARLLTRTALLPLFTPVGALTLAPLFLLFLRGDVNFIDLRFQYSAAVIPFLFLALVFGYRRFLETVSWEHRRRVLWGVGVTLLLLNGGSLTTVPVTSENLTSIAWARSLPEGNVVTHGHLLPYMGYRRYNYYLANVWERKQDPLHDIYSQASHILIDRTVNAYPLSREEVDRKLQALLKDPRYHLIRKDDDKRYLFERKTDDGP